MVLTPLEVITPMVLTLELPVSLSLLGVRC